ncbi:hypothetical protein KFE25_001251 [Diacronema lutheri]|uniref:Tubby C-terminal domain-containing protein n=4 Tax=Diacronema lutheri TaxID=2081491 RepID=A0A8J6CBM3_DIALT|nr:hypothetical protein KFE25_001251 [Diacronema lutheri]
MGDGSDDHASITTHTARMKLDRPKSAAMRPSASVPVLQGAAPRADAPPAPPKPAAMQPLYNLNFEGAGGGAAARTSGHGAGAAGGARPQSARMSALQAMRGQAYQEGSDDDDDDDENATAVIDSPRSRERKALAAADDAPNRPLTTSSSTILAPRGGGARKASALSTASMLGALPQPLAEEPIGSGVSDAMISARLKNARQRIQQREGADDPWGNGGDKGDDDSTGDDDRRTDGGASAADAASLATSRASGVEGGGAPATPLPAQRQATPSEVAAVQIAHALVLERDQVSWLTTAVGSGPMVQCLIKRDKSGLDMLYPQYRCYLQTPDGDRFIMAARKRKKSNSNNYVISTSIKDLARHSESCIGKLRSNFIGTEFVLYDDGYNPRKLPKDAVNGKDKDGRGVRKELALCLNTQNVVGAPSPRKVRGILPQLNDKKPTEYKPMSEEETILQREKEGRLENEFMVVLSKQPRYNNSTGKYSLNFAGRVKLASVKNVQMVYAGQEEVLMQFGKIGKNDFILDFQYPFTPMQAFAFGLTSLAYKLANEGG